MTDKINIEDEVHRTHCCVIHGCKYNDKQCPVANGQVKQKYICQDCHEISGWNSMLDVRTEIKKHMGGMSPYVSYPQYIKHWAYEQEDKDDAWPYVDIFVPDDNLMDISEPPAKPVEPNVTKEFMEWENDKDWVSPWDMADDALWLGAKPFTPEQLTPQHMADQKYMNDKIPIDENNIVEIHGVRYVPENPVQENIQEPLANPQRHVVFEELFEILANHGGLAALTRAEAIFNTQEREINGLMEQRTQLEKGLEAMSNDNVFQRESLTSNENQIAYLTTANQDLLTKVRTADNDLRLCEEQADKLEDNHIRAINTISHLETRIYTYKEAIERMEADKERVDGVLKTVEQDFTQMEEANEGLIQRMGEKYKDTVDDYARTAHNLKYTNDELASKIIQLERELEEEIELNVIRIEAVKAQKKDDDMHDIGVAIKDIPYHWGVLPTSKDMTILDKLHCIENSEEGGDAIYAIQYSGEVVSIMYRTTVLEDKYYPTFEDCINAEYERVLSLDTVEEEEDEVVKFNDMCRNIHNTYHGTRILGFYNPWDDNSQLVDVVDIVMKNTGSTFFSGDSDIYNAMKRYINQYSGVVNDNEHIRI